MGLIFRENNNSRISLILDRFSEWSIRNKLILAILPPVIFILLTTGFVSNRFSAHYLSTALERSSRLICVAQAHSLESLLEQARLDLSYLANQPPSVQNARNFLDHHRRLEHKQYREVAYIGPESGKRFFLVNMENQAFEVPPEFIPDIRPNPLVLFDPIRSLQPGQIHVSDVSSSFYPGPVHPEGHTMGSVILRLSTPVVSPEGRHEGFLVLGIDVYHLRNILTLYNSPRSPLHAFPRTPEIRYSYLFDHHGWMLFQSESGDDPAAELSTSRIRHGMTGTLGKPGFENAFRPGPEYETFWKIVAAVQSGQQGALSIGDKGTSMYMDNSSLAYAPIRLTTRPGAEREILFGLAYLDRSRLKLAAQMRQYDILFIITILSVILITIAIILISRKITRPIFDLANSVTQLDFHSPASEIQVSETDRETTMLKNALNRMIVAINEQLAEIRRKERHIQISEQREKFFFDDKKPEAYGMDAMSLAELIGFGRSLESLKSDILKAAGVDADVLITGETGTGKQLTAEAIHYHSQRRDAPFITVNCGALDENLLLDAMFGHVKGAFSDARTDRQGAFLAANLGTLFLDEIGNASPKVQQALLRTLSVQKIKPLGSDQEVDIDVRLISATNEDLTSLIERGIFREDLYFRLKVISITTPPLRERPEDIPALVEHFIREASARMNRPEVGISKGALERLKHYHWPGNVRELKNCITRAVAMVESDVIQTEDIRLEESGTAGVSAMPPAGRLPSVVRNTRTRPVTDKFSSPALNDRQAQALPRILEKKGITRQEYQNLVGGNLTGRTALYDLQALVRLGLLKKVGKGKNTRYIAAK